MSGAGAVKLGRERWLPIALAMAAAVLVLGLRAALVGDPLDVLTVVEREGSDPVGVVVRAGSVHLPRGGPYRFAVESPGPARVEVAGKVISTNPIAPTRIVLAAGAEAIRVAAPPGARLLWHPPGRVSDVTLEYLPASALSPHPPARASFGRWAGAAPGDALASWSLVLIAVGLASWLGRHRLRRVDRRTAAVLAAVVALALATRLWDLSAAGQTWDEDVNWSAGRNYLQNLLALDARPASWRWNYEHPPVTKYLAGLGALWSDGYGPARAVSALVMALACGLIALVGARLGGLRAGVLAGLIAALTPHLIAHGKIVGHEGPTVLWWALAMWLSLRVHDAAEQGGGGGGANRTAGAAGDPSIRRLVGLGVVVGLAIATRFVNGLLAVPVMATIALTAPSAQRRRILTRAIPIVGAVAVATLYLIWPRLWLDPIGGLLESWQKLQKPHSVEPFFGQLTNQPSMGYFPAYLMATAPLGVLLLALGFAMAALHRGDDVDRAARRRRGWLVALWLLAPLGVMASPVRQDGVRYILPSVAMLALAAGLGAEAATGWLARRAGGARDGAASRGYGVAVAMVVAGYLGWTVARAHPYYLDYYGEHVGGPASVAAAKRFEIAWWGEGLGEAVDYVNQHAAQGARVDRRCVEPGHLTWLRGDLWDEAPRSSDEQWLLVYQPALGRCQIPSGMDRAYRVEIAGAPLVDVYRRRP